MNWLIIVFILMTVCIVSAIIFAIAKSLKVQVVGCCSVIAFLFVLGCIGLPLGIVQQNIRSKYNWYMETRLKYAEAEGIEKEYLEMTDVITYNLWYAENKEALEDPWSFKSAAGCEFDYIKIKGEDK